MNTADIVNTSLTAQYGTGVRKYKHTLTAADLSAGSIVIDLKYKPNVDPVITVSTFTATGAPRPSTTDLFVYSEGKLTVTLPGTSYAATDVIHVLAVG